MKDRIYCGDSLEILKTLPDQLVRTVVTSPPYWRLRDYEQEGQIGQEGDPQAYTERLVKIFREIRRVLKDDGTIWINIGDTYSGTGKSSKQRLADFGRRYGMGGSIKHDTIECGRAPTPPGLKFKDLVGIPWRVAFALQADGWFLRQDIIWYKTNALPESVRDRCTKAHEYLFLLSKAPQYYFDAKSIEEPAKWERWGKQTERKAWSGAAGHLAGKEISELPIRDTKNKRSVWQIATVPCKDAHFAIYPPALVQPCILAGSERGDIVLDPFIGSGTTAIVAKELGRHYIGIDLNPEYCEIARKRLSKTFYNEELF